MRTVSASTWTMLDALDIHARRLIDLYLPCIYMPEIDRLNDDCRYSTAAGNNKTAARAGLTEKCFEQSVQPHAT